MNKIELTQQDLSLIENNALNIKQMQFLLSKTPQSYIRKRPAKGGGEWTYVSGGYVKKVLNMMFGFDWDFEILSEMIRDGEVVVKGKLTVRTADKAITKTQYGNKDIICRRGTDIPLSIGNDLKAAATDCLKKCAAELGIAADVYNSEEFKEVSIIEEDWSELKDLFEIKKDQIPKSEISNIEQNLNNHKQYSKIRKYLKSL